MVAPVFQPQVEKLKDQPNKYRDKSCEKKIPERFREKRRTTFPVIQAIHHEYKRPPCEGKKPCFEKRNLKCKERG